MINAIYIIKDAGTVPAELWSFSVYSEQTAWQSLDGTKVIVKFPADTSADLSSETVYLGCGALWDALTVNEWREDS